MRLLITRDSSRALLPAAGLWGILALAWVGMRWAYLPGAGRANLLGALTIGWIFLVLVLATFVTILWVAHAETGGGSSAVWRQIIGAGAISLGCGILMLIVCMSAGTLDFLEVLQLFLVLASWLALIAAITACAARRRIGGGATVIVAGTIAAVLMAAPVAGLPILRALDLDGQQRAAAVLTHICPCFAVLSAVWRAIPIGWMQMPEMYHLTTVGQDIPVQMPIWWVSCVLYTALFAVFGATFLLSGRRE